MFDPQGFRPFTPFLLGERLMPLGRGSPQEDYREALLSLIREIGAHKPADRQMAQCCLAGIYLLHDFLDESHDLSQNIESREGSFWHAIMHRREGDFGNSKYWFRRVGEHPIYPALAKEAAAIARSVPVANYDPEDKARKMQTTLTDAPAWDSYLFVDWVAGSSGNRGVEELAMLVARAEWETLFEYCFRRAFPAVARRGS